MKTPLINDSQTLVSAQFNHGTPIPVYDDGYGKLYIHRDLNGDYLDILTPALVESLGITLNIEGPATTESIFDSIMASSIFRLNGPKIDLCQVLIDLCAAIKAEEETNWSLGECGECTLDSLLVGAYWSLTEWHAGQNSAEYAALCAIGSIFSPGCTSTPTEDDNEYGPYSAIGEYFAEKSKAKAE